VSFPTGLPGLLAAKFVALGKLRELVSLSLTLEEEEGPVPLSNRQNGVAPLDLVLVTTSTGLIAGSL
jgi:hypothetical protein